MAGMKSTMKPVKKMDAEDKADSKKGIKQSPAEEKTDYPALPHQMVTAIRNSKKGKVPAGLAKYMTSKKK